ncbi:MAG: sigma-70 family RNA polymerase sigma factor [Blautia sp.]|nr:sigma-70 family RNA polymerase sigma factor [Blautia sp.]MDY5032426.1 sigma-70 family RNA polymerase sigma factor [Blautia sp.]
MLTDEQLYDRYFSGERQSAEQLVERYGDSLIRYINGYISDYHESEDLMIETFAQMFAKKRLVTSNHCFKAYLYKTARNLSVRHCRKKRFPLLDLQQAEFEVSGIIGADADILKEERNRQLLHAMEMIKDEYREVLYLLYFEDMKYEEAGRIMGKNVSQITNLAHRAKKSVKRLLEKEGFT